MTKKTATQPETVTASGPLVKLVSSEYERKINLETISSKRPYESAAKKITMWMDIAPEEQGDPLALQARLVELDNLVKERVTACLQETVAAVRAADQSLKYSSIAIEKALDWLISTNLAYDPETRQKWEAGFWEALKTAQSFEQSQ